MSSRTTPRVRHLSIIATAAALLVVSACGGATVGGSSPSTTSAPSTAPAAAGSSQAAPASVAPSSGAVPGTSAGAQASGAQASGAAPTMVKVDTGAACAPFNLAMNDWVGYTADAAVLTYVAQTDLKCKVNQKALNEQTAWQGFASGQIDVIMENWGHEDLAAKYITTQKVAVDDGATGNIGNIGWYVTPSTLKQFPDITNWENLNKYADKFTTSESGGKGQILDGDPSFVTNDAALVTNLKLNYKVVYAGSEAALITAFRTAEKNNTPMIGYFYSPQWFLSEVPLVKISLPKYTTGCDTVAAKVACDYPTYDLNKVVAAKFAGSGSPAAALVKNFHWTNDDQNLVAKYISADNMSPAAAAKKWVDANQAKVDAWLGK
jgi:glycine betaine/proline transport system substrate-binding protein